MAKKPGKRMSASRSKPGTDLVPSSKTQLPVSIVPSAHGGVVVREGPVTLVAGEPYRTRAGSIPANEIYRLDEAAGRPAGPWLGEADKVAWRDPATGYECIMLRATHGGYLSGYVGVPRSHPLWGYDHKAVPPELGIEVHGGLTYGRICQEGPPPQRRVLRNEARRICHISYDPVSYAPIRNTTDHSVADAHAWWFGFDCNHAYDIVPYDARRFLGSEIGAQYRDDAYVCNEVLNLAAQLKAIADGTPLPERVGPPLPSIGLDPRKGA